MRDDTGHKRAAASQPTSQPAATAAAAAEPTHIPATRIAQLQKVCDVYDIFDPAVDYIIRHHLRTIPAVGRRTWEFALIFLALHQAKKLNRSARGLAMGAGTERLIYSIAELVGEAVITDLYHPDEGWKGVRTNDPQKLVMDAAPWPIPEGRIKALPMDMRELKFPDSSFDFAWSTGAIEHIGGDEDFLRQACRDQARPRGRPKGAPAVHRRSRSPLPSFGARRLGHRAHRHPRR
jgi:hypothetical protein